MSTPDTADGRRHVTTSDLVAFLAGSETGQDRAVEVIETHLSWVFRYERHVLKLKKPLVFLGQDLRSAASRRVNCENELALNRRFAPLVYLDIVEIGLDGGRLRVGEGEPVDWLVRMRRLPDAAFLDRRIAAGTVDHDRLGVALSPLIRHYLVAPPSGTADAWILRFTEHLADAVTNLAGFAPRRARVAATDAEIWLREHGDLLRDRFAAGRVADGHGDLRPEHVCLAEDPAILDCLEFDAALRRQDGLDELGYLALECELLGDPATAEAVIAAWTAAADDDAPPGLLPFYQGIRALRRASVAAARHAMAVAQADRGDPAFLQGRAELYLAAAERKLLAARATVASAPP